MNLAFKQQEIISKWFRLRFEREPTTDQDYFNEWLNRFEKGEDYALLCMDSESLKIWLQVKQ
jgi:hypothetical protein